MRDPVSSGARLIQLQASDKVEFDMTAPHGAVAARYRGHVTSGMSPDEIAKRLRVAGQIQVEAQPEEKAQPEAVAQARPRARERALVGRIAPGFRAISFDGKMVDLKALRGKNVWLIFYRYATCPLCNLHLSRVAQRYRALRDGGLEVVAVFESAVPEFFQPGGSAVPGFPVIADPGRKLHDLYETQTSLSGFLRPEVAWEFASALFHGFKQGKIDGHITQMPSHFLIDPEGIVRTVHHGKTAVDHLSWPEIGRFSKIPPDRLK